jgi:hypothetical protein
LASRKLSNSYGNTILHNHWYNFISINKLSNAIDNLNIVSYFGLWEIVFDIICAILGGDSDNDSGGGSSGGGGSNSTF